MMLSDDDLQPDPIEPDQPVEVVELQLDPLHPPPVIDWWLGTPEAVELGTRALTRLGVLRDGKPIRAAVATLQKRWGHAPTGSLNRYQWRRLLEEGL